MKYTIELTYIFQNETCRKNTLKYVELVDKILPEVSKNTLLPFEFRIAHGDKRFYVAETQLDDLGVEKLSKVVIRSCCHHIILLKKKIKLEKAEIDIKFCIYRLSVK